VPAANGVSEVRGEYERALLVVMGVVTLVLLVACANLATRYWPAPTRAARS
jgi:hypothetical protein